nr:NAC domain-containing protein 68-like [Malus domestica]
MAHSDTFPVGYKCHPRDEELVGYYLYNKVRGTPFRVENVIPEIDPYGSMEARDIWNNNGEQNLEKDEDLYFFTKLKPAKGTGSRVARTIGSGTWKGETAGAKVKDPKTKALFGIEYDIPQQQEHATATSDPLNVTNLPTRLAEQQHYFVTQDPTVAYSSLAMAGPDNQEQQVQNPAMASSLGMSISSQEGYLQHNGLVSNVMTDLTQYYYSSTQDPSSGIVSSQYDPPQTATTGFANQPHYFVTQDHQPHYVVADATVASSLSSPSDLDHNHHIMDKDQLPPLTFDYTPGDIMIDLDDLWNN